MSSRSGRASAHTVIVSGVAGSGKSTLGRAVAAMLRLPMLDLDSVTTPLLDRLAASATTHWLTAPDADIVREGRYAALRAVAHDVVATVGAAVLVAPFTAELRGEAEWTALVEAIAPSRPVVLHLDGDADLLAARRAARGDRRDRHRPQLDPVAAPAVAHLAVEAELAPAQQLLRVGRALGVRTPIDPRHRVFTRRFQAVLFDLDGTLVDSTASVIRSWRRFAREFGVSLEALHDNHGQSAGALVERLVGPDRARAGTARIAAIEVDDAPSVHAAVGARELFAAVPAPRRAVVTSGTTALASARLDAAGMVRPATFVTIDDVRHGKPHPEPYLLAAAALGVPAADCLVVEDAPAGIASAHAAGCSVLAVLGTASPDELAAADLVVDGLDRVGIHRDDTGLRLVRRRMNHPPP